MPENKNIGVIGDGADISEKILSDIIEVAQAERESNPDADMEKIAAEVEVDPNAELEARRVTVPTGADENAIDIIAKEVEDMPSVNIDIFDAADPEKVDAAIEDLTTSNAKENFNLSDEETMVFMEIIHNFNKPGYKIYDNLPESVKVIVNTLMKQNGIAIRHREEVARTILKEMISDAGVEQAFVDFEKSLNEALNVPSIVDMYTEHTRETMEVRIPEMIEKIKDIAPEKAEKLQAIKDQFTKAYNFSEAYKLYEANSQIRKAVRRYDNDFKRSLHKLNYANQDSTFKFNDAMEMPVALTKVLITDPFLPAIEGENPLRARLREMKITDVDIKKFCILIASTCSSDSKELLNAAYTYYLIRNIITLKHTQEAKTDFAVELINNICDVIAFIRDKEAYLHATNLDKSEPAKKLHGNRPTRK